MPRFRNTFTMPEGQDRTDLELNYPISGLPIDAITGMMLIATDGDANLAWGDEVVNSGAGATKYLVWWNGAKWAVIGK